ncbi:MAG: hypothetical protein AB7V42_12720 [Thermoleophilia bacterium]
MSWRRRTPNRVRAIELLQAKVEEFERVYDACDQAGDPRGAALAAEKAANARGAIRLLQGDDRRDSHG